MGADPAVLRAPFLRPGDWIHRRVEAVSMSPDGVTRREVSLDVDLAACTPWPADAEGRLLVPATIRAKQPLRHFDATCNGEPAPVLTTEDNGELAETLLRSLVPVQLPRAEAEALAGRSIPDLVRAPQLFVQDVLDDFRRDGSEVNVLRMGSTPLSLSQSLDRRVFRTNEDAQRAVDRALRRPRRPGT